MNISTTSTAEHQKTII